MNNDELQYRFRTRLFRRLNYVKSPLIIDELLNSVKNKEYLIADEIFMRFQTRELCSSTDRCGAFLYDGKRFLLWNNGILFDGEWSGVEPYPTVSEREVYNIFNVTSETGFLMSHDGYIESIHSKCNTIINRILNAG